MHRKHFFIFFAAVAALLVTSVTASAQIDRLRGEVTLNQADGKPTPVEKATVEVVRLDKPGNKETTTDKKGNFTFALEVAGDYVLAVSAPNAKPMMLRVKAGTDQVHKIALESGDGRRITKEQMKAAATGKPVPSSGGTDTAAASAPAATTPTTPTESADDKAKRAEIERKNEELKAKNVKVEESNAIVVRTFKAGNEALKAKRYDEAITLYNEGLAADPEQPALLTNKAFALTQRGVDRYNAAKDDAARGIAKKDFADAAEAAKKAYDLVNAETPGADAAAQQRHTLSKNLAIYARAEAMRLFVSKVDQAQLDAGVAAYDEYIATLTDPAKKLEAQLMGARMLFDAGKPDKAAAAYQKILEGNPENVDASLYAGLSLYSTGDTKNYQQAANYLQHFVDKAPDTHPMKASAREVLTNLKDQQNVKPQKSAGGRRRG